MEPTHARLVLGALIACAAGCGSSDPSSPVQEELPAVGTVEMFAELPTSTEGIAIGQDVNGALALFAGGGSSIYHVSADRTVSTIASVPTPLGIAYHPDGYLVVCGKDTASAAAVLWKVQLDGTAEISVGTAQGSFAKTNFVMVDTDGSLLFSDSDANKVYRARSGGASAEVLTDAIHYPNGMALSPDGAEVFVASWDTPTVYRLARAGGGFAAPEAAVEGVKNVDGVVALSNGSLVLVTSGSGIVRAEPGGATQELAPPEKFALPANGVLGRGDFGDGWLYVTNLIAARIDRVFLGK